MTSPTDRITDVLRKHYLCDEFTHANHGQMARCRCDMDDPDITNGVEDGGWMPFHEWAAHAAERIAAELQLTEETAEINGNINGGWYGLRRRRWVSAWSAVEENP